MIIHLLNLVLAVQNTEAVKATATYYAPRYENRKMANGELFHEDRYTVAFNRYPLGTWIKLTNPLSGKSYIVQITDRKVGKGLDLSKKLYIDLGLSVKKGSGILLVKVIKRGEY
jgi:rare lipoprotein A